jgi:hypothetical protein
MRKGRAERSKRFDSTPAESARPDYTACRHCLPGILPVVPVFQTAGTPLLSPQTFSIYFSFGGQKTWGSSVCISEGQNPLQ